MLYGDTSDNILKIRNTSNSEFIEIGNVNQANLGLLPRSGSEPMTGQLLGHQLSVANGPAYTFQGDDDTGMYRSSNNVLGFSTAGVERCVVDSHGFTLRNRGDVRFMESTTNGTNHIGLQAPASVSSNVIFSLPPADGSNGQVLQTNGSGALSFITVQGVPVGAIFCWPKNTIPTGYLECNGDSIPNGQGTVQGVQANFSALRQIVGSSLPDLRGEFVRGWASDTTDSTRDQGRGIKSGQSDDIKSHKHTVTSNHTITDPGHVHSPTGTNSPSSTLADGRSIAVNDRIVGNYGGGSGNGLGPLGSRQFMNSQTTGISIATTNDVTNTGGSETRPRNVALMYIIKF